MSVEGLREAIETAGAFVVLVGRDGEPALTGLPSAAELAAKAKAGEESLVAALGAVPAFRRTIAFNDWTAAGVPGPLHTAVAALPTLWYASTAVDDRLARALDAAGPQPNVLVEDADAAGRTSGRPDVLKLAGDGLKRVLRVAADYQAMPDDERVKLYARLRDWLEKWPTLLVGCDPALNGDFDKWEYGRLIAPQGGFGAGAWLVWPGVDVGTTAVWAARGVTIVDAEPLQFLADLKEALTDHTPVDPEVAHWEKLAATLKSAPSAADLRVAVEAVPAAELPDTATIEITVDLGDAENLQTSVEVTYRPDRGLDWDPDSRDDAGQTLDALTSWAKQTKKDRTNGFQPDETAARAFFDALFPAGSERLDHYKLALFMATQGKTKVRHVIRLPEERGALWAIPWELMHDGTVPGLAAGAEGRGFLGLGYPVYRWVRAATAVDRATGGVTKALLLAADASQTLTKLDEEATRVKKILEDSGVQVTHVAPDDARLDDPLAIRLLIGQGNFELLHFMGHGQFDPFDPLLSGIKLGTPGNDNVVLPVTSLAEVARDDKHLKLVFLSACEAADAGAQDEDRPWEDAGVVTGMVRAGVPTAVGMRWKIEDDASEKLVSAFYKALATPGVSIEKAVQLARQELKRDDRADWVNPILVKKHHSFDGTAGFGASAAPAPGDGI